LFTRGSRIPGPERHHSWEDPDRSPCVCFITLKNVVTKRIISLAWDTHKLVKNQQYNLWNNATIDLKHERGKKERTYKEGWKSGFRA
jgi:hypothetical protein